MKQKQILYFFYLLKLKFRCFNLEFDWVETRWLKLLLTFHSGAPVPMAVYTINDSFIPMILTCAMNVVQAWAQPSPLIG